MPNITELITPQSEPDDSPGSPVTNNVDQHENTGASPGTQLSHPSGKPLACDWHKVSRTRFRNAGTAALLWLPATILDSTILAKMDYFFPFFQVLGTVIAGSLFIVTCSYFIGGGIAAGRAKNNWEATSFSDPPPSESEIAKLDLSGTRVAAGILGIFLGWIGVHKLYLGYPAVGFSMLVVGLFSLVLKLPLPLLFLLGLIEGTLYLTKSDERFIKTYVFGRRPWF